VSSTEQSETQSEGAKCQRTERSVDRHGGSSVEHGAIRGRREAGNGERGAIRKRRGTRSIVYRVICRRCRVPSAEHGAIRDAG